jgi:hypothetical protein
MATTQNLYTGDGSTTNYSFTFEYLKQSDVKVTLDTVATTAFTFANATTLSFTTAPANGVAIRIFRDTAIDTLSSTFFPGSAIKAEDLNQNFTQSLYVTQESETDVGISDATANAAKTTAEGAVTTANSAVTTANSAVTTANNAVTTANSAVTTANTADTNASAAVTTANAASATATTASTDAASAVTTANTASTNASAAVTTANSAATDAATAITTANGAVTTANSATTAAAAAQTTANNAVTTANGAVTTANTASTNASAAVTTANTANTNASAAVVTANAAAASVSSAVLFELVANVAAIPGSPADQDYVEVADSTGIESFSPLSGVPAGFTGASGLTVRIRYDSSASSWVYMSYFANDSEDRYLTKNIPVVTGDSTNGSGQITLNCETNSHGIKIKGPPHSAAASYTLTLPNDTGTSGYVLKTDGSGTTTWGGADVVFDTTPQLGGDLDVNGHDIVSSGTNTDIAITAARHITLSVDNDVSGHDGEVYIAGGPLYCASITGASIILGSTPTLRGTSISSLSTLGNLGNSILSRFELATNRLDLYFGSNSVHHLSMNEGGDFQIMNDTSTQRGIAFYGGSTNNFLTIKPPSSFTATTYYLPTADGSAGQVLSTDGSGNMSWATSAAGSTDSITEGNTSAEVIDTGTDGRFVVTTEGSEAMRIDSSGNVGIGTTSTGEKLNINGKIKLQFGSAPLVTLANAGDGTNAFDLDTTTTVGNGSGLARFYNNGVQKCRIEGDGSLQNATNSYGALSDLKLKENVVDANSQWDDLKALQVRNYNLKAETQHQTHPQIGLIAQEVELVSPGLVRESPDRDEDGNDLGTVTKSVNYSVLYMKAVKALQEAMERIETLEQRLSDAGIA